MSKYAAEILPTNYARISLSRRLLQIETIKDFLRADDGIRDDAGRNAFRCRLLADELIGIGFADIAHRYDYPRCLLDLATRLQRLLDFRSLADEPLFVGTQ